MTPEAGSGGGAPEAPPGDVGTLFEELVRAFGLDEHYWRKHLTAIRAALAAREEPVRQEGEDCQRCGGPVPLYPDRCLENGCPRRQAGVRFGNNAGQEGEAERREAGALAHRLERIAITAGVTVHEQFELRRAAALLRAGSRTPGESEGP